MSPVLRSIVGFLGALAGGGVTAALLVDAGLGDPWPALIGWLVFVVLGVVLVRLGKRRGAD